MNKLKIEIPEKIFGVDTANMVDFLPLVVLLIAVLMSINLVFIPKINELEVMNSSLKDLREQTQTIVEKTRYLQSIDPAELQRNADFLSSALMPQRNAYVLVDVIRKAISKHQYQVDSFLINPGKFSNTSGKVSANKGVSTIPITIEISGPKSNHLALIKSIERTLPLLSITSFKLASTATVAKLNLEVTAYYLEDSTKFDINRLTLNDLTLKKEETDLVTNLSSYDILEKGEDVASKPTIQFKKYTRKDPFNL